MSTYYFSQGAEDDNWANPNNWYFDSNSTIPANSVPSSADDAIILGFLGYDSSSSATINNLFISDSNTTGLSITVLGLCTIDGGFFGDGAFIIGDVLLTTGGYLLAAGTGTIVGDLTFENNGQGESGANNTDVYGNVYFLGNWTGPYAGSINIYNDYGDGNAIFYYGYTGSASPTFYGTGISYYANYPTLYFNAAIDTDWNTVGNWWVDSNFSNPSYNIPNSSDDAYILSDCNVSNIANMTTISHNLTIDGSYITLFGSGGSAELVIIGNLHCLTESSVGGLRLHCNGATFSGYSWNNAVIDTIDSNGLTIFEDNSSNQMLVYGEARFDDYGYNVYYVNRGATFNDSSYNNGIVQSLEGYGNSTVAPETAIFNGSSYNIGTISGRATFNDYAYNHLGSISDIATFNYYSFNSSPYIDFDSVFNSTFWSIVNGIGTFINGRNVCYYITNLMSDEWNNSNNWYRYDGSNTNSAWVPTPVDHVVLQNDCSSNSSGSTPIVYSLSNTGDITFGGFSIEVISSVSLTGTSQTYATITCPTVTFYDSAYNSGTVDSSGTVTFNGSSSNGSNMFSGGTINCLNGTVNFNDTSINNYPAQVNAQTINFDDIAYNDGIIYGNTSFYGGSYNFNYGTLYETTSEVAAFYDNSYNYGYVYMPVSFNNYSYNDTGTVDNGSGSQSVEFNDYSYNNGTVNEGVDFNDYSYNNGTINAGSTIITFSDSSYNIGTINGGTINWNGFTGVNIAGRFTGGQSNPNQAITLYFDGAAGPEGELSVHLWSNIGNWRIDNFTGTRVQSPVLPSSIDDVVVNSPDIYSGMGETVVNLTVFGSTAFYFSITVTGVAIFNDGSSFNNSVSYPIINGNAIFNDNTVLMGEVDGNVILNDNSCSTGYIVGTATFNNNAYIVQGSVYDGQAIFNDNSFADGAQLWAGAIFNDNSSFVDTTSYGPQISIATFNDFSTNSCSFSCDSAVFNDNSVNTTGSVISERYVSPLEIVFNDNSINSAGTIQGNATFNHNSVNFDGDVTGNATFNDASYTTVDSSIGTFLSPTRTPYPLRLGINNSNILGMI